MLSQVLWLKGLDIKLTVVYLLKNRINVCESLASCGQVQYVSREKSLTKLKREIASSKLDDREIFRRKS